jgi:phenylpyruvate tautomerase PptA (4-oxalocrotonate tautomerase family)
MSNDKKLMLTKALMDVITEHFHCHETVVSIALEPIAPTVWHEHVYIPEIIRRQHLLSKSPNY